MSTQSPCRYSHRIVVNETAQQRCIGVVSWRAYTLGSLSVGIYTKLSVSECPLNTPGRDRGHARALHDSNKRRQRRESCRLESVPSDLASHAQAQHRFRVHSADISNADSALANSLLLRRAPNWTRTLRLHWGDSRIKSSIRE